MFFIIKKRLLWILKNPIYYIGAILLLLLSYNQCHKYLEIHYFKADSKIEDVPEEYFGDTDIMDGYIPMTKGAKFEKGLENLKNDLIKSIGEDENQVNNLIKEAKRKATVEEANSYIKDSLEKEDYADYFGRKYSDFLGVGIIFYSFIIFAFFYSYDYKKDIYELLHTKPIAEWKYLLAKALAGVLAIGLAVAAITICFQVILMINKSQMDLPLNTFKLWKYVFVCNMPTIVYMSFFYLFIAGLFRTPLPAIPILFLQLLYSNNGVENENGMFHYIPKFGSILIRFPELFFETKFYSALYFNQGLLIALAIIIFSLAVFQWNRKRV